MAESAEVTSENQQLLLSLKVVLISNLQLKGDFRSNSAPHSCHDLKNELKRPKLIVYQDVNLFISAIVILDI